MKKSRSGEKVFLKKFSRKSQGWNFVLYYYSIFPIPTFLQLGNVCDFAIGKKNLPRFSFRPQTNRPTQCVRKKRLGQRRIGGGKKDPGIQMGTADWGRRSKEERKKWAIAALGLCSLDKKDPTTCIISLVQLDLPRYGSLQVFALQLPYRKKNIR